MEEIAPPTKADQEFVVFLLDWKDKLEEGKRMKEGAKK
jgi:hypothetical protein